MKIIESRYNSIPTYRSNYRKDNDIILKTNKNIILSAILSCRTPLQVESSIGFAFYLSHIGISRSNYRLFLKVIESNNKWVVDALIGNRDPKLLFSNIRPNRYLITRALQILSFWHPSQIYSKALLSLLGILEYSFYKPDDGYGIYALRITDLNNIGKYLDEEKDQEDLINRLILEILDKITRLGEYQNNLSKNIIAKHAFYIRIAFMDHTKSLLQVIPQVLLVNILREKNEINPTEAYINFIKNRK